MLPSTMSLVHPVTMCYCKYKVSFLFAPGHEPSEERQQHVRDCHILLPHELFSQHFCELLHHLLIDVRASPVACLARINVVVVEFLGHQAVVKVRSEVVLVKFHPLGVSISFAPYRIPHVANVFESRFVAVPPRVERGSGILEVSCSATSVLKLS